MGRIHGAREEGKRGRDGRDMRPQSGGFDMLGGHEINCFGGPSGRGLGIERKHGGSRENPCHARLFSWLRWDTVCSGWSRAQDGYE